MRAFIYARYSAGSAQKDLSIEGQLRECQDYARQQNIDIVGEYADRHISGRTDNRVEFRRLMRDCEKGVVDAVLVWKLDRFFRDRAESALYRKKLAAFGVKLISVREPVPEGSAGIITSGMLETLAEWYSAQLAENVTRGMYDTARKGLSTGPKPLGYKTGPDKRLHIDPPAAELVQRIFESYDHGMSRQQIAEMLNKEGHKTQKGRPFTVASFSKILNNEKYIGIVKYGDSVVLQGGCPRIIEDDLFFRVQRKFALNRARPGANKATTEYYLSGKLFCGHCGSPMVGICGTGQNGRHYYYACDGKRHHNGCRKKNLRKADVEQKVLSATLTMLTDETISYLALEVEKRCAENTGAVAMIASLKQQLAEVEKRLKNIGNAIAMGIVTETTKELLEAAESDRAALRRRLEIAQAQATLVVTAEQVACWLVGFRHGDRQDPAFRREVFGALVHKVFVYDDHLKVIFNSDREGTTEIYLEDLCEIPVNESRGEGAYFKRSGPPEATNTNYSVFFVKRTFGVIVDLPR